MSSSVCNGNAQALDPPLELELLSQQERRRRKDMLLREEHGHSRFHLFRAQTKDFYHAQLYQVFVDVLYGSSSNISVVIVIFHDILEYVNGQPDRAGTGPCHKRMHLIRSGTRQQYFSDLHLTAHCCI